jgi:tRNA acetyltransferase TAN1
LNPFNLIATCGRGVEFDAAFEFRRLLSIVGDEETNTWESGVEGLILGRSNLDPTSVIDGLRTLLKEKPWEFRFLRRVIPVEMVVETDLDEIGKVCKKLSRRIGSEETFRVTVEKRRSKMRTKDIIHVAAQPVPSPVNLEDPDKIILIEVIGDTTGISLLEGERGVLNVNKELLET